MHSFRKFAAYGGLAFVLAIAMATALVACGSATPPAAPQPEHDPTVTPAPQAAFHIVRIPTEGRFSEPVECWDREKRPMFTVHYLHGTVSANNHPREPLGRGRHGEQLEYASRSQYEPALRDLDDDTTGIMGTRTYMLGVPGERVLVESPPPYNYGKACFVGQLTDARLPP
ncbi:MAG: hypothetical protein OXF79_10750 [Chloroflexi bacterium]|nr:hypothetical protein [Chloroflexota bacterium]